MLVVVVDRKCCTISPASTAQGALWRSHEKFVKDRIPASLCDILIEMATKTRANQYSISRDPPLEKK